MNTLAIGLVILSAILHALRDFFSKQSKDKSVFIWQFSSVSILLTLPPAAWILWHDWPINPLGIVIGLSASIVHCLYWYALAKALEHGDLSHVYPIGRSAPAFVLLFSVLILHETATGWGVIGILLVVVGAYAINLKTLSLRGLSEPIRVLRHDHALRYALLTLAAVTTYTIVDDRGVEYGNAIVYFFLTNTCSSLLFTLYIRRVRTKAQYLGTFKRQWRIVLLNAVLASGGYTLMLMAYTLERASYVSGLRQLSIPIAVMLGGHVLREPHKAIRFGASCMIVTGAVCIALLG